MTARPIRVTVRGAGSWHPQKTTADSPPRQTPRGRLMTNTESPDRPLDWATEPMMSPLDTLMWRGDADRRLRGTMCAVEMLDRVPDWGRLLAAYEWASRMAPRLRQRVVDSPLRIGAPSWSIDADFDLHYHLRRVRVPGDGSWRELFTLAEQIAMTPLDPARPPWEAILIDGLPDGRAAYLLKLHHAATDGLGVIDALRSLHSPTRESTANKPQPSAPDPDDISAPAVIGRQLAADLSRLPHLAHAAAGSGLRAATRPRVALHEALRYARSAFRVAGLAGPAGSPLLRRRSLSWRFLAFDIDLAALKAASKVAGASVNDAYLAGLTAAFRRYHDELDQPIDTVPVTIPISTRRPDDPAGGNRIGAGRLAAPLPLTDPVEAMATIREQVRAARSEPAADLFDLLSPVLAWLPGSAMSIVGATTSVNDLQASNVPGITHDAYLAGAKVERIYPFAPLPGCAVMATLVTHGPVACLGINYDAAAITDPHLFADCIIHGFTDVLALAGDTHRPTHRA